jgi:hypothetical protein
MPAASPHNCENNTHKTEPVTQSDAFWLNGTTYAPRTPDVQLNDPSLWPHSSAGREIEQKAKPMMRPFINAAAILALCAFGSTSMAQVSSEAQDQAAVEAAAAQKLSALGQYNYNSAAAAKEGEDARAMGMETNNRALREWYARKQLNADYVAVKYARNQGLLQRVAELKRPDRLSLGQYSRRGRQLIWPSTLKDPIFDEERVALDQLFAQRGAFDAGTDSDFYRVTAKLAKQMHEKLVESIDQFSTSESISARKFLRSLEFEARILPNDLGGLVVVEQ